MPVGAHFPNTNRAGGTGRRRVRFPAYAGATAGMRSLTDRFAVDAHLRQRDVDEFLLAIRM